MGTRSLSTATFTGVPARERETLRERLITGAYTAGEGEFYDLDYADALERITRARDEFVAAGLRPRGFIAPAWLLGSRRSAPRRTPRWSTLPA
jgi:predicted deacetylase